MHFKLDYVNAAGDIVNYYPDFLVRLSSDYIVVVETQRPARFGRAFKMQRLRQWWEDVNALRVGMNYDFVYVNEAGYKQYAPKSFADLLAGFREYKNDYPAIFQ